MRLLLAITELAFGGAENVVLDLERGALEAGHEAAVAAATGPLEMRASKFFRLPAIENSPVALARTGRRLAGVTRAFAPDLVHAHNPRMAGLAAAAARVGPPARRPPVLATYHGVPPEQARAGARVLRLTDHVVCVSARLAEELAAHGVPERRVTVIPNGVSTPPGLDAAERSRLDSDLGLDDEPLVTAVGRLVPQKAHHRLVDAAAAVRTHVPTARFLIVGDGPLRSELEGRIRAAGLEGAVTVTGPRPDARQIIARSDVVAFSSDWEGLSLVALEALAAGVPIVSTDVAGTAELVRSGAGVTVPRSAAALADALVGMLRDPGRRQEMGAEASRLHRERFSTERMIESYLGLYRSLSVPDPLVSP
jgi:glycosyltransferase involved in cell wall biosynthesis